jgi:organic hydroperoxide reductase OsmC/OhrA
MLWYLHLCSAHQVTVLEYCDAAYGVMEEHDDGAGEFVRVVLNPTVRISAGNDRTCFIARSVRFPVDIVPEIMDEAAPSILG